MSDLPDSYAALSLSALKLSHHPASSPTPTPVILVTLYRPTKNNAYTKTMSNEISTVMELLDKDERVKCIVVTGHGKMLCPGADLEQRFGGYGADKSQ